MKAELLKEQACSIAEDHVPPAHQDEQMKKICQPDIAFSSLLSSSLGAAFLLKILHSVIE